MTVSSFVHRQARLDLSNLPLEHGYHRSAAYNRSKLADLLFTNELQRRPWAESERLTGVKLPAPERRSPALRRMQTGSGREVFDHDWGVATRSTERRSPSA